MAPLSVSSAWGWLRRGAAPVLGRVAIQTVVRAVFGLSLLCLFVYISTIADMYSTRMTVPFAQQNWPIPGLAAGQTWPSPLPLP